MAKRQRRLPRDDELEALEDGDMDALSVLPLRIIPLATPALARARMIKNQRLEGVIELFADEGTGSGQISMGALPKAMGWDVDVGIPDDYLILRKLSGLPSYDVFSLRITLREAGVALRDADALKLSPEKSTELAGYMKAFTGPLIGQIYGAEGARFETFDDLVGLFRDPDVKTARAKLKQMAEKLAIGVMEIPAFLEDYGDVFLSLSFYRRCLDRLNPHLDAFIYGLDELRKNWQMRNDPTLMRTCDAVEDTLSNLTESLEQRFRGFDTITQQMWTEISAARFRRVKEVILANHTVVGGVLCALTVKMGSWHKRFPNPRAGGPVRRAEFMMSELKQGLAAMQRLDEGAPSLDSLGPPPAQPPPPGGLTGGGRRGSIR